MDVVGSSSRTWNRQTTGPRPIGASARRWRLVDDERAATPASASSTSTRTATSTSSSRTIEEYGIYLFDPIDEGLDAQGHGRQGRRARGAAEDRPRTARTTASSSTRGTSGGRTKTPPSCPTSSIAARSTTCLKDVEPRGKIARGLAEVDPRRARASRSSWPPPSRWCKDPIAFDWGADGKLWVVEMGDYPLGVDGKGKPGGVVRILEDTDGDGRYDKADRPSSTASASRPACMPWRNGRARRLRPRHLLRRGPRRRRQGRPSRGPLHRLRRGQPAAPAQRLRAGPRRLGLRRQRRQRRHGPLAQDRARPSTSAAATSASAPTTGEFEAESGQTQYGRHRDDWGHWFGNNNPNWAWHYVLADPDLRRNPQVRPARPAADARARHPALSRQPDARPVQRPRRGQPRHLGQQPDALPRRPLRPRLRHQPVRQRAGAQPGPPDGARARRRDLSRPSRGRTRPTASSSPRATTGSGPRCSRPAPTARSGSPTCTAPSSSIPSGFPTTGRSRLDLRAGSDQGRIYRVYPGRQEAPADPPARPARHRRAWSPRSTAPAAGSATRPSGCCCTRSDPAAIAPLASAGRATTKRPQDAGPGALDARRPRRPGRADPVLAGLGDPHPQVRESVVAAVEALLRRLAPRWPRPCCDWPTIPIRRSGSSSRCAWATGTTLGPARPSRRSAAARRARPLDPRGRPELGACRTSRRSWSALLDDAEATPPPAGDRRAAARPGRRSMTGRRRSTGRGRSIGTPAGQGGRYAPWQFAALAGLLDARDQVEARSSIDLRQAVRAGSGPPPGALVADDAAAEADRLAAVRLLGHSAPDERRRSRPARRLAPAAESRSRSSRRPSPPSATTADPQGRRPAAAGWKGHSPQLRAAILDTLLSRTTWTSARSSRRSRTAARRPAEIDPAHRAAAARAAAIRASGRGPRPSSQHQATPRQAVVDAYRPALDAQGRPGRRRGGLQEAVRLVPPAGQRRASRSAPTWRP